VKLKILFLCAILAVPALASAAEGRWRAAPAAQALRTVGLDYRRGGDTPEAGFDCSGLVVYAYQRAWGRELPRSVQEQAQAGRNVRLSELQAGDLVFFNTRGRPYTHVGIYLGDGRFVHAPRPGAKVRIESVETRYWQVRFSGARRLDPPSY